MKQVMRLTLLVGLVTLWDTSPVWSDPSPDAPLPDAARAGVTMAQAQDIFIGCRQAARATPSALRPVTGHTIMWCAVVDREGHLLLIRATDTGESPDAVLQSDAWRGSIEIAIAKAYTGVAFSDNELALTSRTIGLLSRIDGPGNDNRVGHDNGPAPLFGIGDTNPYRPLTGNLSLSPDDRTGRDHHGIVTFAGGVPVYSNPSGKTNCTSGGGKLLGAVGVSGDGVDEDEKVAIGAIKRANFCTQP